MSLCDSAWAFTSASSMKVTASGLQDWLIILIRSGNLEVDSSPFREKTCTDPSTSLWICARWPSYLQLCKLWPIADISNVEVKQSGINLSTYSRYTESGWRGFQLGSSSNKVDRNTTRPKACWYVAEIFRDKTLKQNSHSFDS